MIELILMQRVDKLGQMGELVKVRPGYARNFLLPRKLALAVTDNNKRQIDRERAKADAQDAEERRDAEALKARIESAEVAIARRVGENNALYGSVTSSDIAEALAARDLTVDRRRIQLDDPLKSLGEFDVPLKLTRDVTAIVKVKVVAAAAAATDTN